MQVDEGTFANGAQTAAFVHLFNAESKAFLSKTQSKEIIRQVHAKRSLYNSMTGGDFSLLFEIPAQSVSLARISVDKILSDIQAAAFTYEIQRDYLVGDPIFGVFGLNFMGTEPFPGGCDQYLIYDP